MVKGAPPGEVPAFCCAWNCRFADWACAKSVQNKARPKRRTFAAIGLPTWDVTLAAEELSFSTIMTGTPPKIKLTTLAPKVTESI
jgi:hypothetical protein